MWLSTDRMNFPEFVPIFCALIKTLECPIPGSVRSLVEGVPAHGSGLEPDGL